MRDWELVACIKCGVPSGQRCRSVSGGPTEQHLARTQAANAAYFQQFETEYVKHECGGAG